MKNTFLIGAILLLLNNSSADQPIKKTIFYQSIEWSHDSKSICFAAIVLDSGKYVNGRWEIYSMNIDGTGLKKLTENNFNDMWPTYSPDDKTIYFQTDRDVNQEIYSMNANGSNAKRITNSPGLDGSPSCSPDGKKILFASARDGNSELYTMNVDGTEIVRLTTSESKEYNPQFSPDGKKIVYYSEKGDHMDQVFVSNIDGTNPVNVTNDSLNNIYPAFSHDGSEIIFQSTHMKEKHVCMYNLSTGKKKTLTTSLGFFNRLSPDGKQIAFISSGWPQSEISICNFDGTGEKVVSKKEEVLKVNGN